MSMCLHIGITEDKGGREKRKERGKESIEREDPLSASLLPDGYRAGAGAGWKP